MDTKIIRQFGTEILCYQISSARQKKRTVKRGEEKRLLQLNKEERDIRAQLFNAGYIDLHPPVVKGWKRYFVLRDDIARSKEAVFYQEILDKINTVRYCKRKDFKRKRWFAGKKKKWEPIEQAILAPAHSEFIKFCFTEKQQSFFEEKFVKHEWRREMVKVFVFKEPWRFIFRVKPNVITREKLTDLALKKREQEIGDYFRRTNKRNVLDHLLGNRVRRWTRSNDKKIQSGYDKRKLIEYMDQCKEER